jgi:hypothetical protein
VFCGVNLFPNVFSESLEFQDGKRSGTFRRHAKDMNDLLSNRPMFALCPCLNLSVQAIRQIFDIQGSHKFLQNAPIVEEATLTVKSTDPPTTNNCVPVTEFEFMINLTTAKQIGATIPQKVLARADRVIK